MKNGRSRLQTVRGRPLLSVPEREVRPWGNFFFPGPSEDKQRPACKAAVRRV